MASGDVGHPPGSPRSPCSALVGAPFAEQGSFQFAVAKSDFLQEWDPIQAKKEKILFMLSYYFMTNTLYTTRVILYSNGKT